MTIHHADTPGASRGENRVLGAEKQEGDYDDRALRPTCFEEFVGQDKMVHNLKAFVHAACNRMDALDHVLLSGPPGLGKTTLAQIIARELKVNFRATAGPVITRAGDLAALLTNLQERDVLFIDEIHRLAPAVEEILYPAMEDFTLDLMIGEGPSARSVKIDLPPFTLVGATTRTGLLATPLRDRFGIPLRLEFYHEKDIARILMCSAGKIKLNLTAEGAMEIARRSRGTPRIAGRLLRRIRDLAEINHHKTVTAKIADQSLLRLEVDTFGLDFQDRKYLSILCETFSGGPVGIETLAAALSESRDALEDILEPFLLQKGFIMRTPRGRVATKKAFQHLALDMPELSLSLPLEEQQEKEEL